MTLVDTNVLLDLLTSDPNWANWSIGQLDSLVNMAAAAGLRVEMQVGQAA